MTAFLLDYLPTFAAISPAAAAGIGGLLAGPLSTLLGDRRAILLAQAGGGVHAFSASLPVAGGLDRHADVRAGTGADGLALPTAAGAAVLCRRDTGRVRRAGTFRALSGRALSGRLSALCTASGASA